MQIQAPNDYSEAPKPWIFLAGSIEMGTAEKWQDKVVEALSDITFLNPRRDDWDSSWVQSKDNQQFRQQVEWELEAQDVADLIIFHFDPETKSPITLMELGLFVDKAIVHCPEGFWKKGNVDIVCDYFDVYQVDSFEELIETVERWYQQ